MKTKRKPLTKIQKRARGEPCYLMTEVCRQDPNDPTVVLCHAPYPGRGGMRDRDEWGAPGCMRCHDLVDGRTKNSYSAILEDFWYNAICNWQDLLKKEGLMEVKK